MNVDCCCGSLSCGVEIYEINLFKEIGGCVAWFQNQAKSLCLAAIYLCTLVKYVEEF
jgi:hypothetical protein